MSQADSTAVINEGEGSSASPPSGARPTAKRQSGGGPFQQYKPEQGKWTRLGTFIGLMALTAWGAKFLFDRLQIYEGDEVWRLMVTTGTPIAFLVVLGALGWWVSYLNRKSSDFMIATEGEMKKVSWSTKREIIGSTKVVILFTVLLACGLFVVDVVFQLGFRWIGVLKT